MTDDSDVCGHETADGTPCQNPASDGDSCWLDKHGGSADKSGRPRERPSKEQQENIASVIEAGGSIREACRRAGVHTSTFYSWLEYGEDEPESTWGEFRQRFVRARGEGESRYRQTLMAIAEETGDTATLMAMLKQRYPEAWSEVDRGEQADGQIEVTSDVVEVTEADLQHD